MKTIRKMAFGKKILLAAVCALVVCFGTSMAFGGNNVSDVVGMALSAKDAPYEASFEVKVTDNATEAAASSVTVSNSSADTAKASLTASALDAEGNSINVETAYQWQILIDEDADLWVDIQGQNAADIALTLGMVNGALNDNKVAQVRCVATAAGEEAVSDPIEVKVEEATDEAAGDAAEGDSQDAPEVISDAVVEEYTVDGDADAADGEGESAEDAADEEGLSEEADSNANNGIAPMSLNNTKSRSIARDAGSEAGDTYSVTVNYSIEGSSIIPAEPSKGTLSSGGSLTISFPTVTGYSPWVTLPGEEEESQVDSLTLAYGEITGDVVLNVVYKPTNVNYKVVHYQQNLNDDKYTEVASETKQGLTGSKVGSALLASDVAVTDENCRKALSKDYDGFYSLLFETPNIAADGSTVIEIYYDRYYYLMNFDMDGGYGTEPIYARYGANIGTVNDPENPGYVFDGWTLDDEKAEIPETMPAENRTYVAAWKVGDPVNYVVVYWKENANDDGYSYWGQQQKTATVGTFVSGSDDIPNNVHNGEKQYFTYYAGKTDSDVMVKGDGSTVVNVYYYRNTYNIYFRGISGKCVIEEHTHGVSCSSTLTCSLVAHETHTADCLICEKTEHARHNSSCCTLEAHTHGTSCYAGTSTTTGSAGIGAPYSPANGYVHRKAWSTSDKVIYINGQWYNYTGSTASGSVAPTTCGKTEHKHGTNCDCSLEIHTHSEANGCYKDAVHKHSDGCYRPCPKLEHEHTNQCNRDSESNVIYVVSAKYQQNIADVWPTADKFPNVTLRGWTIDGISSEAVSKRVTMTSELCDTSDRLKYAQAQTGGSEQTLYYMFESFDQTSSENGYERKKHGETYYDKSGTYSQVVNSGSSQWGLKPIDGMKAVERVNADPSGGNNGYYKSVFLYYDRLRYTLSFYNVNDTVKTVANIMFEQPLKDYKDSDGNLLRDFEPDYPKDLEPNAYEFAGWYTTPECYSGTEFNFTTATMPNGNVTLYAKWAPVRHAVEFYLTEESEDVYTPKGAEGASFTVPHGSSLDEDYVEAHLDQDAMNKAKPNGGYTFVMWYYYDENGAKKPFDPTTQIRKDLTLYGEWSSNELKPYTVQYVLVDDPTIKVAADLTGSGLAGHTKTFDAKIGDDLSDGYRDCQPLQTSQSLLLKLDASEEELVVTFEYTQPEIDINYVAVGPAGVTGFGSVSSSTEKVKAITGPVAGSTPTAGDGFEFVGWFKDAACTQSVDSSWISAGDKITPQKADKRFEGATYYAKFKEQQVTINYVAVGPEGATGFGSVNPASETLGVLSGTASGSTATAGADYEFVGWFKDAACTQSVDSSWVSAGKITPQKTNGKNVTATYYAKFAEKKVTIEYEVVGPTGCGTVSPGSETLDVLSGTASGSTATANSDFKFVGWYSDAACSEANLLSADAKYVPAKVSGKNVEATYYAKFEYDTTSLTITKAAATGTTFASGEAFVFTVTGPDNFSTKVTIAGAGSVTIDGLKVGSEYTVTESGNWSWRYTPSCDKTNGKITLSATASNNKIVFTNSKKPGGWLDFSDWCKNVFDGTENVVCPGSDN